MKTAIQPVTLDMFSDIPEDSTGLSTGLSTEDSAGNVTWAKAAQTGELLGSTRRHKPAQRPGRRSTGKDHKAKDHKAKSNKAKSNKDDGFDHLAAARKLQWRLRKARSHSPEEMKAGRLICQHLLAMLDEASNDPSFPAALPPTQAAQKIGASQ